MPSKEPACPSCGFLLPQDAPRGLCPACVMGLDETVVTPVNDALLRADHDGGVPLGRFGDLELLGEIARGGMGVVYRARQLTLDRVVAVKVILAGRFADPQFVQRFRGEAAAAAVLQHPNIVAIHEIGLQGGHHYFTMDFVPGRSLDEIAGGHPLAPQPAAALLRTIAEAIHYAHERGILHRDLKPSNVLIDDTTGEPRITDFGLAKRLDAESGLTVTGQVLGTPNFMPPEQAGPGQGKVGRASDVYGLGAILYFLLTGRAPFQDETLQGILRQLATVDPLPPRLLNPGVPLDLETICLKCLEKEPARRYATARELAEELKRYLGDEPILARPVSALARLGRWCRRQPSLAGAFGVVLVLLSVVIVGSPLAAVRIDRERRRAEQEAAATRRSLYIADMNLAQQALAEGNLGRTRELLRRHIPGAGMEELRDWEWFRSQRLSQGDDLAVVGRHDGEVGSVVVSSDGRWMASAGMEGKVQVWALTPLRAVTTLDTQGPAIGLAFTPDGRQIAALSRTSGCRIWETATAQELAHFPVPQSDFGGALAISHDGGTLAVSRVEGAVELWSLGRHVKERELAKRAGLVVSLQFGPADRLLFVGDDSGAIQSVDLAAHGQSTLLSGAGATFALAPDGDTLARGDFDGTITVWSLARQKELARLAQHSAAVMAVAFSPDGSILATAGGDQTVRLTRAQDWKPLGVLRGHEGVIRALAFVHDSQTLVSGGRDQTVRLWDTTRMRSPLDRVEWSPRIAFAGFLPQRREAVSVHTDGKLRFWDLETLTPRREFSLSLDCSDLWGGSIYFNGPALAVANHEGTAVLWDPREQSEIARWQAHRGRARCITVSSDGTRVATSGEDGRLKLWNVGPTPRILAETDAARTYWMAFAPDGTRLAATHEDGSVSLWNLPMRGPPVRLTGHKGAAVGTAFSPDGRWLATAAWDGTAKVWDLASGQPVATLSGQLLGINCVVFSPESHRLALGGQDGTIKLWDTRLWQEAASFKAHGGEIWEMAFLPDRTLASTGRDALRCWRVGEDVTVMNRSATP